MPLFTGFKTRVATIVFMPAKEWFKPSDVEWLKVSGEQLGQGRYGTVYRGRIKFRGKPSFSVAVKQFHFPKAPFFNWGNYEKAISSLKQAGVRMPKMAVVEHEGRKVLVSELFASRGASKIFDIGYKVPPQMREALLDVVAKIINAGYEPAPDAIGALRTGKGFEPIVHDFDFLAQESKNMVASSAQDWLRRLYPVDREERVKALETLLTKVTHPTLRNELQKIRGNIGFRNE